MKASTCTVRSLGLVSDFSMKTMHDSSLLAHYSCSPTTVAHPLQLLTHYSCSPTTVAHPLVPQHASRMWRLQLLVVLVTLSVVQCDHHLCPSGYSRGQYLDASTQKYLLCWKVDWSDRSITFSAKVATTGWIGLGFSPTGFMPNSDIVIGWVKDGQGYLKVGTTPWF